MPDGTDRNKGTNRDAVDQCRQNKSEEVIDVEAAYNSKYEDGQDEPNNYDYMESHANRILSSTLNPTNKSNSCSITNKPKAASLKVRIGLLLNSIYYPCYIIYMPYT